MDTGNGTFEYDEVIGGNLGLSKLGSGTLILKAANDYSGDTFIRNGTLEVTGGNDRLPSGTTLTLGDAVYDTSGILQLVPGTTSCDQTLGGLYNYGGSDNCVVVGGTGTATLTITYDGTNQVDEYDGGLGGLTGNEMNLALDLNGSGTVVLTGESNYYGGTTIESGTLQINSATPYMNMFNIGAVFNITGGSLVFDYGAGGSDADPRNAVLGWISDGQIKISSRIPPQPELAWGGGTTPPPTNWRFRLVLVPRLRLLSSRLRTGSTRSRIRRPGVVPLAKA